MAAPRPASRAMAKKVADRIGRQGRPKEILLTPSTVARPSLSLTRRRVWMVSIARFCSAETVRVKQSMITSSRDKPTCSAAARISSATVNRSLAVSGMPLPSSARPMTAAPYFAAKGRTALRLLSSPFTELISTLPSATLRARSRAAGSEESSTSG